VIQALSDAAVHAHCVAAATATEPAPPDEANAREDTDSEKVHDPGLGCVGELLLSQAAMPRSRTARTARDRDMCVHIRHLDVTFALFMAIRAAALLGRAGEVRGTSHAGGFHEISLWLVRLRAIGGR
jgi:hypothetical protein